MAKKKISKIASKKKSSSKKISKKKTSTKKAAAKRTAKKPKLAKRRKVKNILLVYREHGTEAKKKAQDLCNWFQERG